MIVVTAQMVVPEGVEEFVEAVRATVAGTTGSEPGCRAYYCSRNVLEPDQFVFVEEWDDMAAIGAHVATPHYLAFKEVADRLVTSQTITMHTVEKSRTL